MNTLEKIASEVATCTKCGLCKDRIHAVPGYGSLTAEIVLIGEGPGAQEDKSGVPFVGSAGKFLDTLLESIAISRQDVFITNVVKCRPPKNRDPLPEEVKQCWDYLDAQLQFLKPKLIILLGIHAMNRLLPNLKIGEAHGKPVRYRGQVYVPMYHPAAALYNGSLRSVMLEDFGRIPAIIQKVHSLPVQAATYQECNNFITSEHRVESSL